MKKKFLRSALCVALASVLVFSDAGVALAAEPEQVVEDVNLVSASVQPTVESLSVSSWSNSELYVSFSVTAYKYDVYVNDKKAIDGQLSSGYYENYDGSYSYYSSYCGHNLYLQMIPGTKYTVKVVPYDENGKAGTAKTVTYATEKKTLSINSAYSSYVTAETSYRRPTAYISWNSADADDVTHHVYRSTSKKGKYNEIASFSGRYNTSYTDYNVTPGKTYYYKVKTVYNKPGDGYTKKPYAVTSDIKSVALVKVGAPSISVSQSSTGEVSVDIWNSSFASGYEVYRSESKNSGYKKLAKISANLYTDKTAQAGKVYYYKVRAYYYNKTNNKTVYGDFSDPRGVKFVMGGISPYTEQLKKNKIRVSWNMVDGADSYEVYMCTDLAGDAYKLIATTTSTSLTKDGLAADGTYYFSVRACKNENGVKTYYNSGSTSITLGLQTPYAYISNRKYTCKKNSLTIKSTITWNKTYGAKGYRIEKYDNGTWKTVKKLSAKTTKYVVTDKFLKDGPSSYEYRVVAYNGKEERTSWVYSSKNITNITKLTVKKDTKKNEVKLSWNKAKGATNYTVYRYSPLGDSYNLGTTDKLYFVDTQFTPGVDYSYEVISYNSNLGAYGDSSINAGKRTTSAKMKVGLPTVKSVKNSKKGTAVVSYKEIDGAVSYTIYRSTAKKGKYKKVGTSKTNTFTDKKLKKGKTYYYKVQVQVINDAGFKLKSALSAPKGIKIKK